MPKPPPTSKAVGGNSVKMDQDNLWLPRIINMIKTEKSGTQARTAIIQVMLLRMLLISVRGSMACRSRSVWVIVSAVLCICAADKGLMLYSPFRAGQSNNRLPNNIHQKGNQEEHDGGIHQGLGLHLAGLGKALGQEGRQCICR